MYVCICNAVTENDIRAAAQAGTTDLWRLQTELGVAAGCGTCRDTASSILGEYRSTAASRPMASRTNERHAVPVRYCPAAG
jgi:bacterioferritin-associated ferredoxin